MQADIEKLANKIMEEEGKESSNGAAIILGSILTLLLLALLSWLGGGLGPWKVISSLIFGCIGFSASLASQKAPYKKRSALYILKDQIIKHRPALRRNLNKAFKRNDYGIVASDKRLEIIEEFRVSINFPSGIFTANEMLTAIESILGDLSKEDASRDGDLDMVPANPILFEQWVADKLRNV